MHSTKSGHTLFHYLIRVPKKESAFTYFQLEASEGLAFYSTTEQSLGMPYRDIDIKGDISLESELDHLLETLAKKFSVEILVREHIADDDKDQ